MRIKFLTSGSTQSSFQDILYDSQRFSSYVKDILIDESQIDRKDHIFSLFSKSKGRHILGRGISAAARMKSCTLIKNDDLKTFIKNLMYERCDYLFCTPSFLWNVKEYIPLHKMKKIQLAGEYVSPFLSERFLSLMQPHQNIINHYGTSETFGIGYSKLGEDFHIIKSGEISQKEQHFYFKSSYTRSAETEELSDILQLSESGFSILGRNNLNFIKKNGKKINLLALRESLFSLPIIDISFKHYNDNFGFEEFDLYLISDTVSENYIRKHIDSFFDGNYQPRNIYFLKSFEKTKNDIKFKLL